MSKKEVKIDRNPIKQILKDKFACFALILLVCMYFIIAFADFFAVYKEEFSDRTMSYAPPSKIFVINSDGKFSKPYTYNYKRHFNPETFANDYKIDRSQKFYLKSTGA